MRRAHAPFGGLTIKLSRRFRIFFDPGAFVDERGEKIDCRGEASLRGAPDGHSNQPALIVALGSARERKGIA